MQIPHNVVVREGTNFRISKPDTDAALLSGKTGRKISLSRDRSLIGVIDNFTIHIFENESFKKIYSFKMVSEERAEKIERENKNLQEMIDGIKLSGANSEIMMLKKKIEREYIQEIEISPDNRFLVSINKFQNETEPNVLIREISTNTTIYKMTRKNFNMENWPIFKWFGKKSIFAYTLGNRLLFYDAEVLFKKANDAEAGEKKGKENIKKNGKAAIKVDKEATENQVKKVNGGEKITSASENKDFNDELLHPPRCSHEFDVQNKGKNFRLKKFSVSPGGDLLCVFLKNSRKDRMSKILVYRYPNFGSAIALKVVKAEEVECIWAKSGFSLLVKHSVNSTECYYMISKLQLFSLENLSKGESPKANLSAPAAKKSGASFEVQLGRSSLQDCAFSNKGDKFIVIAYQPMRPKLFRTSDSKLLHDFENLKCNKVIWSPNDRFVWLAGVINMSGFMYFYDMKTNKKLGEGEHQGARYFSWSADSKYFITGSLSPWRRVDNMLKIWSFSGKLLLQTSFDHLYQCFFLTPDLKGPGFSPEDLSVEERKFLVNKGKTPRKSSGFSYTVPYRIEINKVSKNGPRRNKTTVRKDLDWNNLKGKPEEKNKKAAVPGPKPRQIFGLPPSVVDAKKKKKKKVNKNGT